MYLKYVWNNDHRMLYEAYLDPCDLIWRLQVVLILELAAFCLYQYCGIQPEFKVPVEAALKISRENDLLWSEP